MIAECLYCDDVLTFDPVRGWVHRDTGRPYRGRCDCRNVRHTYSHDLITNALICPTWRDDHAALPKGIRE